MIDLITTNSFTLVDMLILMVAAFATGLALAWKGPERAISAQRRIDAVHAGFDGQVSELPQSGGPVDNLFVGLECYTVVGCSHVHQEAEAEECQHGRCPKAIESLLSAGIDSWEKNRQRQAQREKEAAAVAKSTKRMLH